MRLRSSEQAAVVAVLEQEHASAETAAHAVFNVVVKLLEDRDAHVALTYLGPEDTLPIVYGVWWDKGSAARAVKPIPLQSQVFKVRAPSRLKPRDSVADALHCNGCGHPAFAHGFRSADPGCVVKRCPCREVYK